MEFPANLHHNRLHPGLTRHLEAARDALEHPKQALSGLLVNLSYVHDFILLSRPRFRFHALARHHPADCGGQCLSFTA